MRVRESYGEREGKKRKGIERGERKRREDCCREKEDEREK